MKTEILNIIGTWTDIMNACRSTVRKKFRDSEPSEEFKKSIVIAEHSPIRLMSVRFRFKDIPSWVATHFSRHKWEKFITTQRSDRTNVNRDKLPQDAPVDFMGDCNVQHLIDTSRKRLCGMASKETRAAWQELVNSIREKEPIIADVCVPNCVYRGGCPELAPCGMWRYFVAWAETMSEKHIGDMTIQERYDWYHKWNEHKELNEANAE